MKTRCATLIALALLLPAAPLCQAQDAVVRVADSRAPSEDEALALAALEGLMSVPPDRSMPILKRVLAGNRSDLVKGRALFVLSQVDTPEAQQILVEVARQAGNPLRREAIRNIGIGGRPESLAALKDIYAAGDEATRKYVLEAWLIANRKDDVFQVALAAKTDAEADRAITTLAAMGARDELRKLGNERKSSRKLLEAYAVAGDLQSLKRIADTAPDTTTRAEALRRMGIIRSKEAKDVLRQAYQAATDAKVKAAALDGLLISGDQQVVLELYRSAKTPEEKRLVLRTLGTMGGEAALGAIDEALGAKK